ncbi:hypothetical protein U14_05751 [Candidatus Moduliflexus flocculans]|uniref:Thioredoxin domain-containing protein n=1 Tax=Candidatus Moduliflexus flocculans TaxID=1499966 RepID=A0A081BST5_9BACT|nr:hypothetical protein U14_05751 [Candidatus Moduliflexus flocculans]
MKKRLMSRQYLFGFVCIISLTLLSLISALTPAVAAEPPVLYLFWGDGCPHCEEEKMFFDVLQHDYPQLEIRLFEVWNNPEFAKLAEALAKANHINAASVPLTFIGNWGNVGFQSFETTGVEIAARVQACLAQGCPDALDKLGPQQLAARVRDEAARKSPQGWELRPAAAVATIAPADTTPAPVAATPTKTIKVYYFHGTARCPSCKTIEELTNFAIVNGFKKELESGVLEFNAINVETPENQHFIKDYQLYTKSVIVSEVIDGKERRWKNLEKVWQLLMQEKAFTMYVQQEVSAYLEGK